MMQLIQIAPSDTRSSSYCRRDTFSVGSGDTVVTEKTKN